ncbi:hypothetical protein Vretimale_13698 [Volvox reticuliferus]|uniref:lipoyl(octanoyl) transferase n=1 Tax=Volvox reticuliferus TaxID=1737510 RepID=A0A8J4CPD2_9CHLO|nr:hypothetical protein Vretifemale_14636 [Volvox reticuliferus]GIM09891.1 hypothetical protein Vretimale_13698 [Volvox reticuliferus]
MLMDQHTRNSRTVRPFPARTHCGVASRRRCVIGAARPTVWIQYGLGDASRGTTSNSGSCSYSAAAGCAHCRDLIKIRPQIFGRRTDPWVYRSSGRADVIAYSTSSPRPRSPCSSAATCRKTWFRFPPVTVLTEPPRHWAVERTHGSMMTGRGHTAPRTRITEAAHIAARVTLGTAVAATAGVEGSDPRVVVVYDFSQEVVDYAQAWAWQRALLDRATGAAADGGPRGSHNVVLLLQHPPVYTLGAGSTTDHLRFTPDASPIPLYRTERGGEVTYHGPGQLVMYPILDLQAFKPDLHWYLRQLEEVVIHALDAVSGIPGERVEGLTGVWVDGAKVAAIGVRAKKWISYHGLALNVVTDLAPFSRIVPCGIADRPVTSVKRLLAERLRALDPFGPIENEAAMRTAMESGGGTGGTGSTGGTGGSEMMPISEASQEDLRHMLARTGMTPTVLGNIAPDGAEGGIAVPELEDPFAPQSLSVSLPSSLGQDAQLDGEAGEAAATFDDGGGGEGGEDDIVIRSKWKETEQQLLREYGCALLEAFADVFNVELRPGDPSDLKRL